MFLYYGMAVVLYIIAIYCTSVEYKANPAALGVGKSALFIFLLITIILGGIRWETGTDWKNYYNYFTHNNTWGKFKNSEFEISYAAFNFFIKYFFNSYTIFLCIMAFFVIFIRYEVIQKIAVYPALSYYLFFCDNIGGMFPVRQTIAISIALTSIYFIHTKNKWAFLLITLLAITFHWSLLIWLLAYPLYYKRLNTNVFIALFICASIIGITGEKLLIFSVNTFLENTGVSGHITKRITRYILEKYSDGSYSIRRVVFSMAKRIVFIPLILAIRSKNHDTYTSGLSNLYLYALIIYSFFAFNEAFQPMARMVTPFLFIEVLLLPLTVKMCKKTHTKYIVLLMLFLYGLMKLSSALNMYPRAYMPYRSIF